MGGALAFLLSGCVGVLANDAGSVSVGHHASGVLRDGVSLPWEGTGFEVPSGWRGRGALFTTDEILAWLMAGFREVHAAFPESIAHVGDLSRRGGGRIARHRSHESGRDVDLFFYAVDEVGDPFRSPLGALRFGPDGWAFAWSSPDAARPVRAPVPRVRLDEQRTWALVSALLRDRRAEIQWIFINRAVADRLLAQARSSGEDELVVARAAALFHQPRNVDPHDDHMHVRVYCDPDDRALGCQDRGPHRWWKKRWKYVGRTAGAALATSRPPRAAPPPFEASRMPAPVDR